MDRPPPFVMTNWDLSTRVVRVYSSAQSLMRAENNLERGPQNGRTQDYEGARARASAGWRFSHCTGFRGVRFAELTRCNTIRSRACLLVLEAGHGSVRKRAHSVSKICLTYPPAQKHCIVHFLYRAIVISKGIPIGR